MHLDSNILHRFSWFMEINAWV